DDLFGHSSPKIEMPSQESSPAPPPPEPSPTEPLLPTIAPLPNDATLTYVPDDRTQPEVTGKSGPAVEQAPLPLPWQMPGLTDAAPSPAAPAAEPAPLFERAPAAASLPPVRRRRSAWKDVLFFSLIS